MKPKMTLEEFLNNHLLRINRSANYIEYECEGGIYEMDYIGDVMDGIRAAMVEIEEMGDG